jgi:prepilin-type N-terminal cleavage/methylation domain-containing protein
MCYANKNKNGFSLIEVIVSIGLFSIIMTIGAGALYDMSVVYNKARALRVAVDGLGLAVDTIARELRFSRSIVCQTGTQIAGFIKVHPGAVVGGDCSIAENGNRISFVNMYGQAAYYEAIGSGNPVEYFLARNNSTGTFTNLTSLQQLKIDTLQFIVSGTENKTDAIQPTVTIIVKATTVYRKTPITFSMQTTVTQRSRK